MAELPGQRFVKINQWFEGGSDVSTVTSQFVATVRETPPDMYNRIVVHIIQLKRRPRPRSRNASIAANILNKWFLYRNDGLKYLVKHILKNGIIYQIMLSDSLSDVEIYRLDRYKISEHGSIVNMSINKFEPYGRDHTVEKLVKQGFLGAAELRSLSRHGDMPEITFD
ncbi:MAG: hypothetical protein M0Z41_08890 [Peptococcaceae bacterium]|nr:hypothetical protein [Peptococcaceae bacterium]